MTDKEVIAHFQLCLQISMGSISDDKADHLLDEAEMDLIGYERDTARCLADFVYKQYGASSIWLLLSSEGNK